MNQRIGTTKTEALQAYGLLDEIVKAVEDRAFAAGRMAEADERVNELRDELENLLPTCADGQEIPPEADGVISVASEPELDRATIAAAIELQLPVEFVYTNGDNETLLRHVSPYELKTTLDGRRFVLGWDHDREGIRHFEIGKAESRVRSTEAVAYRQPVTIETAVPATVR